MAPRVVDRDVATKSRQGWHSRRLRRRLLPLFIHSALPEVFPNSLPYRPDSDPVPLLPALVPLLHPPPSPSLPLTSTPDSPLAHRTPTA